MVKKNIAFVIAFVIFLSLAIAPIFTEAGTMPDTGLGTIEVTDEEIPLASSPSIPDPAPSPVFDFTPDNNGSNTGASDEDELGVELPEVPEIPKNPEYIGEDADEEPEAPEVPEYPNGIDKEGEREDRDEDEARGEDKDETPDEDEDGDEDIGEIEEDEEDGIEDEDEDEARDEDKDETPDEDEDGNEDIGEIEEDEEDGIEDEDEDEDEPISEPAVFLSAAVTSYGKNMHNGNRGMYNFTVTVTMTDGSSYAISHKEEINGKLSGGLTFTYALYSVYIEWDSNNRVIACEVL